MLVLLALSSATSLDYLSTLFYKNIANGLAAPFSEATLAMLFEILRMDRIIVLQQGKIIEQGTHQELLARQGKYHAMWKHQRGDFLAES